MDPSSASRNPIEELAEEFSRRLRLGERPSLTEYTRRYPELAEQIRELFPALAVVERLRPSDSAGVPPGSDGGREPPRRLGEYQIIREVGRGGMGVVYEAVQESLGRHVALKVLPDSLLAGDRLVERFRREARAAGRLHHTNIVPVFGTGDVNGTHFYAMQFIPGQGLDRVLEDLRRLRRNLPETEANSASRSVALTLVTGRSPESPPTEDYADREPGWPPPAEPVTESPTGGELSGDLDAGYFRKVAQIGLQVAEALAYAHRHGVLHRDIKPSNLLLDLQGTAWVTDFGLAKADDADDLSRTGDIVGTVRYMAPERFEGRSLPQSDVYGLGLTLYELLTLRPAFDDPNRVGLTDMVRRTPALPPRRIDPRIPRDFETVVMKCAEKDPAQRYPSAAELAEDLRRFLSDRPVRARRASRSELAWRWCRRNPAVSSLMAAIALILVAATVGSLVTASRFNEARLDALQAKREARLGQAEALIGKAHGIRYSRRPGQRFDALEALGKAAGIGRELGQPTEWFDELRNEAIAALALPDLRVTREWDGFPPGFVAADFSEDFQLYARADGQGGCSVRRVADNAEVARLPVLGEPAILGFGPGRLLAVRGATTFRIRLWDLGGTEPRLRVAEEKPSYQWDFDRNGNRFAVIHTDGAIGLYDPRMGTLEKRFAPITVTQEPMISLHPTEPLVAVCSYFTPATAVLIRETDSGRVVAEVDPPWPGGNSSIAWSPDGRTLSVAAGDGGDVQLYDFNPDDRTFRPGRLMSSVSSGGQQIRFNPAGDRLAARGWGGIVHLFDVTTGSVIFSTPALPCPVNPRPRFGPTGRTLGITLTGKNSERIGLSSVADGREYRRLVTRRAGEISSVRAPAIHPNGRLAAHPVSDGVAFFDLVNGEEVAFLPIPLGASPTDFPLTIAFDGKGSLLTNQFSGFLRWPVRPDPTRAGRWTVGPPDRLPFHPGNSEIAASGDGRVLAQSMWNGYGMSAYAGGWILHPNAPRPRSVDRGTSMGWVSVSPDGHWVAFNNVVYEAATGREVRRPPGTACLFSPDGRRMITNGDNGRVYSVATWEPLLQLGPGTPRTISRDSTLVVMGLADGVYRLVELATGRELARLEDPEQINGAARLTPDGTRLVVAARAGLRVWDLRLIRRGLAKLGIDWDAPAYPEVPSDQVEPIEVRLIDAEFADPAKMAEDQRTRALLTLLDNPFDATSHHRLGAQLYRADHAEQARVHLSLALAFDPETYEARRLRASIALELQRWEEAIADSSRYLERYPDDIGARYVRAQAYLRSKQYEQAILDYSALLEQFPRDSELYESRAICHKALGHAELAKADREAYLRLSPEDPERLNEMAWQFLTGPESEWDPARALKLVEKAVQKRPGYAMYLNTLGVAQYRNDMFPEAVVTLEQSLAAGKGEWDGFDLFFLAMCHAKLGDLDKAARCFNRAAIWTNGKADLSPGHQQELKQFRAEAAEALGRQPRE